ncbi:hypothetical protein BSLG_005273 [Batrachochytrium salamandrivorans]|nr:hypothetical protein BSLG_005273 [Batrachochytrium salamandrivorans]
MLSSSTHTLGRNLAPIPFYIATGYDRSPRRASLIIEIWDVAAPGPPSSIAVIKAPLRDPECNVFILSTYQTFIDLSPSLIHLLLIESANTGSNLFVSGLSMDAREEDLGAVFSKYGKITKCEVMFDPRSKGSRGFGFVNFENIADADDALALNGVDLLGRPLNVQKTVPESFVQVEAGMMNVTRIVAGADMMTVTEVAMMTEIETETETETEIEIAILGEVVVVTVSSSISSVTKPTSATSGSDSLLVPATSLVRRPLLDLDLSAGLLLDLRRRLELLSVTLGLRSRPRSLLRLRLRFRLICRGERDLDGDLDLDQPLEMGGDSPRRRRVSTASSLNDRSFWPDPRT